MIVELAAVKAQLRVDDDYEDLLLQSKIEAAQGQLERMLGFEIEAIYGGEGQPPVPEALCEAVLHLVGRWFENRTGLIVGESVDEMPVSFQDIVREYRRWSF